MTWTEALPTVAFTLSIAYQRFVKVDVKSHVDTKNAETQLKVGLESSDIQVRIVSLQDQFHGFEDRLPGEVAALVKTILGSYQENLKASLKRSGIAWTDDVTTIPGKKD